MKNFAVGGIVGILLVICILFCCVTLCFFSFFASIAGAFSGNGENQTDPLYTFVSGSQISENKILRIRVNGIILTDKPTNPFLSLLAEEVVYGYEIKKQLQDAAMDNTIKAVVLEVNSPGGTVTGAAAIADGITYYKSTSNKPIYGFGSGVVASGGYWVISGTDKIYLDQGSSIGSIGVILGPIQTYDKVLGADGILTEGGITSTYFSAGEGKDFGNPFRGINEKERTIYQDLVNSSYNDFVNKVAADRSISEGNIRNVIGAHLYGEDKALEYKLIDGVMNRDDLLKTIAEENSFGDNYQFIDIMPAPDFFSSLFGASAIFNKQINSKAQICSQTGGVLVVEQTVLKVCE